MVFSSFIFLFFFLPLFLAAYYAVPFRWKSAVILAGSYVFYAWWRVDFLLLFAGVTLWNYAVERRIAATGSKRWLQAGVAGNLACLFFFKYFNFGVDSLNLALAQAGMAEIHALRFLLPIGISFHAFQSISFLADVYRGDAPPARRFLDFAAYSSLFPQMIAGPIVRYKDIAAQFEAREHSLDLFSRGAYRFMIGFSKKILIADTVAPLADAAFALGRPGLADSWLGALAYAVQLYFDFSGYSDMAIGLGLMMGFRFLENFDQPYASRSITEFWRRWHISLSSWLRDYLYIPLGGNRAGRARTYFNLFVTMLLGGLWHGANWTFALWGAWHGMLLAFEKALGLRKADAAQAPLFLKTAGVTLTFILVLIGWVMFRAPHIGAAANFYEGMTGLHGGGISEALQWQLDPAALIALAAGLAVIFLCPWAERRAGIRVREMEGFWPQLVMIALFLLAVTKLSYQAYSPFLYFQF
jgi:alginate O-acetyltransferase complex protein AlgI